MPKHLTLADAAQVAVAEAERAATIHKPFNSAHEGFAILAEEVDELWEAVRDNDPEQQRAEAIQVAAMALRFLHDLPKRRDDLIIAADHADINITANCFGGSSVEIKATDRSGNLLSIICPRSATVTQYNNHRS